ncbi:MAG TPA: condensation domain-containing protein, partial [Pyrinomonadaceae bacterium]
MLEIQKKIGGLSPEKRALLELRLKEQGQSFNTFPLSFAQERLWLIDQLGPGSPAYNIPIALQLSGLLNIEALERTVNEIVRRHEVLRTTYRMIDAGPVQAVSPFRATRIPLVDLTHHSETERELETKRLIDEEARQPFNLTTGPMFRVTLLQLDQQEHVLLFTMHHIASDMWSTGVLVREVSMLYEAFSEGRPSPLEELSIQYADFAVWQRKWLQGELLEQQLGYWKKQLEGAPPILELPVDRPRPPVQTLRGDTFVMELSEELSQDLRELGQSEDATLFMLVLAAFKVLLYRYTSQSDLVVGVPIANRNRVQTENLIGFFVNTLALRTDLSGEPTFREVVRRVRETSLGAYAHQDLPFEKIVQELNPERNQSFAPLFQVCFGLQPQTRDEERYEMRGLTLRALDTQSGTSKFDLVQKIVETKKGLTSYLHYNTDIFEEATIRRMSAHFRQLLEDIVEHPDVAISQLALLSAEERAQQLVEWNDSSVSYARQQTLHELFETQAAATPEAIALVYEAEQLSYRELNERSNQLAHYLRELGVGPETLVGLCCERSLELVVALLGVLKAGGAYLPLDPQYPHERLAFMVQDAGISLLLTHTQVDGIEQWAGAQTRVIALEREWESISQRSVANPAVTAIADNLAYMIYTSGSTGQPKGTLLTHYNVTRLLEATAADFTFNRDDVWTLFHSYAFDFSVWEIWGALAYGGRLVVVPYGVSRSPAEFYQLLRREGVTVLNQTPSAFRQLSVVDAAATDAERAELALRLVIFGGEALEWQSLRGWFERHGEEQPQLVNMYGITETTVHVTR